MVARIGVLTIEPGNGSNGSGHECRADPYLFDEREPTLQSMTVDIQGREHECTELLQALIGNQCVNDGSVASGGESRSADLLRTYLEGSGLDIETYEAAPGRTSLVARIEGTDPDAPTLLLMGHTDVVPVNPEHWRHDPFGGELIDGEVWGRGAVDMLNLTASMAVATKRLARSGFAPRGTLIYLAVADEEAHGAYGAGHLIEHERESVMADYVITESGGIPLPSPSGLKLPVIVGEKGVFNMRLTVRGTAGHGSQPYRTDNALVTAAEVVRRIDAFEPATQIHEIWQRSERGESGYTPVFWRGDVRPGRDAAWMARERAAIGDDQVFSAFYPMSPAEAFVGRQGLVLPQFREDWHVISEHPWHN